MLLLEVKCLTKQVLLKEVSCKLLTSCLNLQVLAATSLTMFSSAATTTGDDKHFTLVSFCPTVHHILFLPLSHSALLPSSFCPAQTPGSLTLTVLLILVGGSTLHLAQSWYHVMEGINQGLSFTALVSYPRPPFPLWRETLLLLMKFGYKETRKQGNKETGNRLSIPYLPSGQFPFLPSLSVCFVAIVQVWTADHIFTYS